MTATLSGGTPYSRPVATDYSNPRARLDGGVIRDIFAVVLVLAGVVGMAVAAFAFDWRLGLATLSVAAITTGAYLGYER